MIPEAISYEVRTGDEFYHLVNRIISRRLKQGKLPLLSDYLSSLWHLASRHKDGTPLQFTYSLLTQWLYQAFDYAPMPYDRKEVLKKPYVSGVICVSEHGTPAYYQEVRTYNYFERSVKRQIEELRRGYANQP